MLGVDLLGDEVVADGEGLITELEVERIGQAVCGIGGHHQGPVSEIGGFQAGGGRDGRLANAALAGDEQDPH